MSSQRPPETVEIAPEPEVDFDCRSCGRSLEADGWLMPGMRPLAALSCPECGREFFGDFPSGHGLDSPTLLDAETGETTQFGRESPWFEKWLGESYADRSDEEVSVTVEGETDLDAPAFCNCLDALYGHALLKLLDVQRFADRDDIDVVVVVQSNLAWLIPDGVAATVTVDLPLGRGYEWNDRLATAFVDLAADWETVSLCRVDPHPHPSTFDIERYSSVEPMDNDTPWADPPVVTFVWRDDRCWSRLPPWAIVEDWLSNRLPIPVKGRDPFGIVGRRLDDASRYQQRRKVLALESAIRDRFPEVDFAVAGVAEPGRLPDRITDLRTNAPSVADEQRLCERYGRSNVVVGVHGSNMLLPSAHAGSTVELLPTRRWGNVLQDLVVSEADSYDGLYHTRLLPLSTGADEVAACVRSLIESRESFRETLSPTHRRER